MNNADVMENFKNSRYFIERFFHIVDRNQKKIPFKLNRAQTKYFETRTSDDLILKARKMGFSSGIEADWLHACMFTPNENAVTMAHTWDDTVIHMNRVKFYIENMGLSNIKIETTLDTNNQRELYFPLTNSRYWIGTAGSRAFGRGRDVTRVHLSEVAHYPNQDVITGLMEACVPGALKVMETTANGVGELFHRLWQQASDPQSGSPWKCHFSAWFEDPEYTLAAPHDGHQRLSDWEQRLQAAYKLTREQVWWYRWKKASMADPALMPQEYPSSAQEAFLSSGRHAFNLEKLAEKKTRAIGITASLQGEIEDNGAKVTVRLAERGRLKVFKAPRRGGSYLISADVGEGVQDGDFSVMHVLDRSSWEQVATWRGRPDPGEFGREMCKVGAYFNFAVLIPELNNHGWATVEAIKAEKYPHLLNTKEIWKEGETPKDGFPQTERTRSLIITALRNAIDDDTFVINDPVTLEECETFIQNEKTGKFEAQDGCHDDCVISAAIGVYCVKFLTVDATYAETSNQRQVDYRSLVSSVINERSSKRKSATGYR